MAACGAGGAAAGDAGDWVSQQHFGRGPPPISNASDKTGHRAACHSHAADSYSYCRNSAPTRDLPRVARGGYHDFRQRNHLNGRIREAESSFATATWDAARYRIWRSGNAQKVQSNGGGISSGLGFSEDRSCKPSTPSARKRSTHLPTVFGVVWSRPDGHGHAAIHHGANSSALDLSASGWHSCGCPISPQRIAAFGKISVPGADRINNLLKVHI